MKKHKIIAGLSYVNVSGRTERHVLDVGDHVDFVWYGSDATRPIEAGVRFVHTRTGNTFYGEKSGKPVYTMGVSAFAAWAKAIVTEGDEAPWGKQS